jgi:hypothetical protein
MRPWKADAKNHRWTLREPGKQVLAYGGSELDLSGETGAYRINTVNAKTGEVTPGETVNAGAKIKLPDATVVWLTKK